MKNEHCPDQPVCPILRDYKELTFNWEYFTGTSIPIRDLKTGELNDPIWTLNVARIQPYWALWDMSLKEIEANKRAAAQAKIPEGNVHFTVVQKLRPPVYKTPLQRKDAGSRILLVMR